uniref:CSON009787 protein n=1 Tax=Culicoides sonorensis TaxID=179676 RepID=A0A336M4T7_CULSO
MYSLKGFIILCLVASITAQCPTIVSRSEWGARWASTSCGVSLGHVSSSYGLIGHRQAIATDCPGNRLFTEIKTWPNFRP